ncbi:MAG: VCBS repeat-containing protein [Deltaproteobacteria bacterium]|nr:VCBS repeat-containing protein [Deltaproteobacteria bacterium]
MDSSWGTSHDLNGDGYDDVVANVPGPDQLAVILGGLGVSATTNIRMIESPFHNFGSTAFVTIGDINGDGSPDALCAAYRRTPEAESFVYLIRGLHPDSSPHLERLTTLRERFTLPSPTGDVNGDGFADTLALSENGSFLLFGAPVGIGATVRIVDPPTPPFIRPRPVIVGDVDQDGYADIAVPYGEFQLWRGGPSGPMVDRRIRPVFRGFVVGIGDVNGDGSADLISGSSSGAEVRFGSREEGLQEVISILPSPMFPADNQFGDRVSSPGDFDGDGFADFALGMPNQLPHPRLPGEHGGTVVIFSGSGSGVAPERSARLNRSPAECCDFGTALAGGSDTNGDGFDDLVVGFPSGGLDLSIPLYGGMVIVYQGSAAGISITESIVFRNDSMDSLGRIGSGLALTDPGTLPGRLRPPFIVGARTWDHLARSL